MFTALGLGLGVGLVVTVAALSDGLDRAQDKVLKPLTGVGTDLSVTRPLDLATTPVRRGRAEWPGAEMRDGRIAHGGSSTVPVEGA